MNIDGLKTALQKAVTSGVMNTEFSVALTRGGDVFNFFLMRNQLVKKSVTAATLVGEVFEGEGNLAAFTSEKIINKKEI